MITLILILLAIIEAWSAPQNFAKTSEGVSRTVFVQMFEWPWKDVAKECETRLGPLGFAAVQISPVTEHMVWENSPWWERYQPTSYEMISRSGSKAELLDMIRRCNQAGVAVYADVVINHMAGIEEGHGFAGTQFKHYEYPIYSYRDFHHCGRNGDDNIKNFFDRYEVQNCMLVNLADLDTAASYVQDTQAKFLNELVGMGVTGFRIDAAKHMAAEDIKHILAKVQGHPYILQELILGPGDPIQAYEYTPIGDVNHFAYAYQVGFAIRNQRLVDLFNVGVNSGISSDKAVVLVDNHDLERRGDAELLTYKDGAAYKLALVFMLAWPYGYPQVYSSYAFDSFDQGPPVGTDLYTLPVLDQNGQCQRNWLCQHRMREVEAMVGFRNRINADFFIGHGWANGSNQIAFSRGSRGFVVLNGASNKLAQNFQTGLPAGNYCNLLSDQWNPWNKTCSSAPISVNEDGSAWLEVDAMSALVLEKI